MDILPEDVRLFCLTTNLCTIHRKAVIDEIKLFQENKRHGDKKNLSASVLSLLKRVWI